MIGQTLGGYRVVSQIGMGGMATVYKAHDASMDRFVALKTLPQQYSADENFRARFEREAKAIAKLEHLHILPIFAYGEQDGITYMVMRLMETGTLSEDIQANPPSFKETARLTRQVASALDYAHSMNVIHRDIKPSNVLLDTQRNAYLTDFGIAKIVEGAMNLTGTGNIIGTPIYMSPEQCMAQSLTPATDQYSLAVMAYQMVTGTTPYAAETPIAIIQMHMLNAPMALPTTLRPDLPPEAEAVLLKGLAHEPADRYESCSAFAEAFAAAVQDVTETVPHPITQGFSDVQPMTDIGSQGVATVADRPVSRASTKPPSGAIPSPIDREASTATVPSQRGRGRGGLWALVFLLLLIGAGAGYVALYGVPDGVPLPMSAANRTATDEAFVSTRLAAALVQTEMAAAAATGTMSSLATQFALTQEAAYTDTPTVTPTPTDTPTLTPTPQSVAMAAAADTYFSMIHTPTREGNFIEPCWWRDDSDGNLCVYDSANRLEARVPLDPDVFDIERVENISFSSDGQRIVVSAPGPDNPEFFALYIIDRDGELLDTLAFDEVNLVQPAWSPDGEWIATHGSCNLTLVKADGSSIEHLLTNPRGGCYSVPQWSPDSAALATVWTPVDEWREGDTIERTIRWVDVAGITRYRDLVTETVTIGGCGESMQGVFTPDGQYIAYESANCTLNLVNVDDSDEIITMQGERFPPQIWSSHFWPQWGGHAIVADDASASNEGMTASLPLGEDFSYLVPCDGDGKLCIMTDGESAPLLPNSDVDRYDVTGYTFASDGLHVAFVARQSADDRERDLFQQSLYVVRRDTGVFVEHKVPFEVFDGLSWQPNGNRIVTVKDCSLAQFNAETGRYTTTQTTRDGCYGPPQWSPDGEQLVTMWTPDESNGRREVRLISMETPREFRTLTRVPSGDNRCDGNAVAFSPDGERVVYHNQVCSVMMYNVARSMFIPVVPEPYNEPFPYTWTGMAYPQWGLMP